MQRSPEVVHTATSLSAHQPPSPPSSNRLRGGRLQRDRLWQPADSRRGAGLLRARLTLHFERNSNPLGHLIEEQAILQIGQMEEVIVPVLGRDEAEAALGDLLLDLAMQGLPRGGGLRFAGSAHVHLLGFLLLPAELEAARIAV